LTPARTTARHSPQPVRDANFDFSLEGLVGFDLDSRALIDPLKRGQVGAAGLDVYEKGEGIFFRNLSDQVLQVLQDDVMARLLAFPNALITSHQAFLTRDALANIADTPLANVRAFERGEPLSNEVRGTEVVKSISGSAPER
jgi:D-lactate dehydrogenase